MQEIEVRKAIGENRGERGWRGKEGGEGFKLCVGRKKKTEKSEQKERKITESEVGRRPLEDEHHS